VIEISALTKKYGDFPALQGLDLTVRPGELHAFLGPNGAGKTTTIKILTGLIRPTSGSARIGGLDVTADPVAVKRIIGYVPDTPWLHDRLTAWEHLRLVAGLHGMDAASFRNRAEELLAAFSIADRAGGLIEDFSLGMRQKLCFAGAFLHRPSIVIIDEPWVGLDPRAVRDVVDFLKDRNREGCTVLMSTHSLPIAERIADRVSILNRGRLVAEGTVAELLRLREGSQLEDLFLTLTEGGDGELGGSAGRP
jgi:ABC-2 type transport system ATP-binding protein